jgi:hypothetical protein
MAKRKSDKRKSRQEGWVPWETCPGRAILLEDIKSGHLPGGVSAKEAWKTYCTLPEFDGVVFDQFAKRLEDHRAQVAKFHARKWDDEMAYASDTFLNHYPRRKDGAWEGSEAQQLLKLDVKNGAHLRMRPSDLKQTRSQYLTFDLKEFRGHIYQEVKLNKFINWLNTKQGLPQPQRPRDYNFRK